MSLDERTARPPDPEHERFRGPAASRRDRPLPHGVSWVVGIAVAALLLAMTLAGARSSRDLGRARARTSELSSQIAEAEARIAELERRIELLRDDPVTLERLAREELGLVRPHDVVVVLPPQLRDEELASTGDGTGAETASARPAGTRGRDLQAEVP